MPRYNMGMIEITPLHSDEIDTARMVIYATAYTLFPGYETLEQAVAHFRTEWPLRDIDDFQQVYVENGGAFLVIRAGGRIIGTGALRRLEDGVGEIKRLWLLPEYQRQGLGYMMMMHLFQVARDNGYTKIRLETSPAYQARAVDFYQQMGFRQISRYGDDPEDIAFELALDL